MGGAESLGYDLLTWALGWGEGPMRFWYLKAIPELREGSASVLGGAESQVEFTYLVWWEVRYRGNFEYNESYKIRKGVPS